MHVWFCCEGPTPVPRSSTNKKCDNRNLHCLGLIAILSSPLYYKQVKSSIYISWYTYISQHLDWKPQINHASMKIAKSIGITNKIEAFIWVHARRQLYCTLQIYTTNLDEVYSNDSTYYSYMLLA